MTQVDEVASPAPAQRDSALRGWLGVGAVTGATFTVVTSEMLPVGLLTPISDTLRVTEGAVGLSLTATGFVAAVAAPLIAAALGRSDRRLVLCVLLAVLTLGNLGAAWSPNFAIMMAARVLVGIGIGGVWAIAASMAARLVPEKSVGAATALVFSGVAVASVIGVPAGTYIGAVAGWRAAFLVTGVLAVVVLVAIVALLPRLTVAQVVPLRAVLRLTREPQLRTALLAIAFLVTGHFAAYTYVRPLLEKVTGIGASTIGTVLLVYGIAGVVGNFGSGGPAVRRPRRTLMTIGVPLGVTVLLIPALGGSLWLAVALMVAWGLSYGGVSVTAQNWVFAAAPDAREAASSLNAGVFNAAIALGALVGGRTADAFGVTSAMWLGGALAFVALAIAALGRSPEAPGK
ncbi:putative MFS family arabinose efflux permease [Nocardia tenerifensis]|uniref:Putative MFS family arabinose efflux permease n=2 Tax=Nocardia tenerifensis TaxID=228006 RepID=A0A318KP52_9NOCA|nr:MFS transporter [Nocardia tenerifensis]PXX64155.1 putative MFS family arabinose efflux permease [Nocardia tenerifensis]